ncbi:hypothetical protein pb186bvf_003877 [Paramecium bursaria]
MMGLIYSFDKMLKGEKGSESYKRNLYTKDKNGIHLEQKLLKQEQIISIISQNNTEIKTLFEIIYFLKLFRLNLIITHLNEKLLETKCHFCNHILPHIPLALNNMECNHDLMYLSNKFNQFQQLSSFLELHIQNFEKLLISDTEQQHKISMQHPKQDFLLI